MIWRPSSFGFSIRCWLVGKLIFAAIDRSRVPSRSACLGGMVNAIEKGYPQREIAASAYRFQRQLEAQERVMVGVNGYVASNDAAIPLLRSIR